MKIGTVEFAESDLQINGVRLRVLEAGEGEPLVCLHGFPDTPHTFIHQYPVLIEQGYRVIAPFLRGYPPSETGRRVDVFPMRLAEDLLELIDQRCEGRAKVLAHDWGAIATYVACNMAVDKIESVIAVAVPHISAFLNEKVSFIQAWRSRYALFFQLGPIANYLMRRNDLASINYLWDCWSPEWDYSEADIRPVKDCLGMPGAMETATGYYRALFQRGLRESEFTKLISQAIEQPALICGGASDGCIGKIYFQKMQDGFSGPWNLVMVPKAGHFVHREDPEFFNREMLHFLGASSVKKAQQQLQEA